MTHKVPFSYCLLQYEHNPWLKERLNIGVMMFSDTTGFLQLKTRGWEGRLFSAYPTLIRPDYSEDLKQIERVFSRFSRNDLHQPSLFETDTREGLSKRKCNHALFLAHHLSPDFDSSYRWEGGGTGLCSSPDDKIDELFQRFVIGYDKEKPASHRTDEQVWSSLSKKIAEWNLTKHIESEPNVQTDLGRIKFHSGYQNGALHLIQPLSFDLADEDNINSKVARWAGYVQSINDTKMDRCVTHFVLGRPSKQHLNTHFERAHKYLTKISGEDTVVSEDKCGVFVERMAEQLSGH